MVAQLREPVRRLEPLVEPAVPLRSRQMTYAYRLNRFDRWQLTDAGRDAAALAQRVLLRYVLCFETRGQLSARYSLCETQVQNIVLGRSHALLTLPLRQRLVRLGIGEDERMHRSEHRRGQIDAALKRLAFTASEILRDPQRCASEEAQIVATDLWLLSGAWREDES